VPVAEVEVDIAVPGQFQVNVYVKDPKGRPLEGAVVRVYRTIPFSLVAEKRTDARGFAFFEGLWPWGYCLIADHEERRLRTPPVHFTVAPGQVYTFELRAKPPPYLYELRVQCGLRPIADLAKWLLENVGLIRDTINGFPGHEFVDAKVEDSYLVITFRVTGSPHPLAVIGAILAILVVLAIIGWEIKEVVPKIPPVTWPLVGVGIAAAGVASLLGLFLARRR